MPDIRLAVVESAPPDASVLVPAPEALPVFRAEGPTRYLCGGCSTLIGEGNIRSSAVQVRGANGLCIRCPICQALLVVPAKTDRDN